MAWVIQEFRRRKDPEIVNRYDAYVLDVTSGGEYTVAAPLPPIPDDPLNSPAYNDYRKVRHITSHKVFDTIQDMIAEIGG